MNKDSISLRVYFAMLVAFYTMVGSGIAIMVMGMAVGSRTFMGFALLSVGIMLEMYGIVLIPIFMYVTNWELRP